MCCRSSCLCSTCIHGYNDICDNCSPCDYGERGQNSCSKYKRGENKLMKEWVDVELVYSCGHKKMDKDYYMPNTEYDKQQKRDYECNLCNTEKRINQLKDEYKRLKDEYKRIEESKEYYM